MSDTTRGDRELAWLVHMDGDPDSDSVTGHNPYVDSGRQTWMSDDLFARMNRTANDKRRIRELEEECDRLRVLHIEAAEISDEERRRRIQTEQLNEDLARSVPPQVEFDRLTAKLAAAELRYAEANNERDALRAQVVQLTAEVSKWRRGKMGEAK